MFGRGHSTQRVRRALATMASSYQQLHFRSLSFPSVTRIQIYEAHDSATAALVKLTVMAIWSVRYVELLELPSQLSSEGPATRKAKI